MFIFLYIYNILFFKWTHDVQTSVYMLMIPMLVSWVLILHDFSPTHGHKALSLKVIVDQ